MSGPINYIPQPLINIPDQYYLGRKQTADLAQTEALTQQTKALIQQEQSRITYQQEMRKDLSSLTQNPRATAMDYANVVTKYPELDKQIKQSWDLLNEDTKEAELRETQNLYSAISTGQIDIATKMLEDRKQAAINSSDQKEADEAGVLLTKLKEPGGKEYVQAQLGTGLASIMGPNNFASVYNALNKENPSYKLLSKQQKIDLGLDPSKSYQLDQKTNKVDEIGGGGTTVNVGEGKFGPLPPGYRYLSDGKGGVTAEVIPGTPQADELKLLEQGRAMKTTKETVQKDIILENIDLIVKEMKKRVLPVSGQVSKKTPDVLATGTKNVKALLDPVKSKISFETLQDMRNASKTGGALGSVQAKELELLESALGSLDQEQDEELLKFNLKRIKTIYTKILNDPVASQYLTKGPKSPLIKQNTPNVDDLIKKYSGR